MNILTRTEQQQLSDKYRSDILNQEGSYGASYKYIPITTQRIIERLKLQGYTVSQFQKSRVRKTSKEGYQKHIVRLRHPSLGALTVGDNIPEIVLINSYDRSSAVQFILCVYRMVCANGLMVGNTFQSYHIRH